MKFKILVLSFVIFFILAGCAKPSDPTESANILKMEKTLSTGGYALDVSISGEYVFVAEDEHGFSIFNYLSGTRFCLEDSIDSTPIESVSHVAAMQSEDILIVYDTNGNDFNIMDISDQQHPEYINRIIGDTVDPYKAIITQNESDGVNFYWTNNNEFKTGAFDGAWSYGLGYTFGHDVTGFDVSNDYYAIGAGQFGFYLLDKNSLELISQTETIGQVMDVKFVDNYLICALREEGFSIYDLSDVNNPQEVILKDTSELIYTVDADAEHLVLSSHSGGVYLYDISDITDPKFVDRISSGDIGYTFKAILHEGRIFAATRLGIQIISF
jgi:hypothetical protein